MTSHDAKMTSHDGRKWLKSIFCYQDADVPGVIGDEAHQHGVPGETLQTGKDGEMSVEDGVRLDLPQSDGGPRHLQHVQLTDLAVLLWAVWAERRWLPHMLSCN